MRIALLVFITASLFLSCKSTLETTEKDYRTLPEINIRPSNDIYRASFTIRHDLTNINLDVKFDWKKQYLFGTAVLTLSPHFYATDFIWLNARGMEILDVKQLSGKDSLRVKYEYANDSLCIHQDKMYKKGEEIKLYIKYISKPEELETSGSNAITSDKGLYFINPSGDDPTKPMQIWTQGETQANSVWFPCIDAPNQKMTQQISITVDSSYNTLSNGLKIKSTINPDGTRTDTWKQSLPHAPYLAMLAVGKFAIVKDKWRDKEVSYYVEPAYENVARKIFGNTPEMLEFFSQKLKTDFTWEKYNQVVVRDYVSGAMENSSATLLGEFMQRNSRQLLDGTNEEFISHELFHHWFGDLVTCESWSNIPLNESFASYGEYLWNEYKYGRSEADINLYSDLNRYLSESRVKQVDMIRFHYDNQEDMYDRHSYEKGANILHMLRKYVGDEAFFTSLHNYLADHRFKTAEIHDLRLAFEGVTGEDLNWFFNEWFFNKGHISLEISYGWNEENKEASVIISQKQDLNTTPLYAMPIDIDLYSQSSVRRERIKLSKAFEIFTFKCDSKPLAINTDAEKMLTGIKTDKHSKEEWMTLFQRAPLFLDRYEALKALSADYSKNSPESKVIQYALKDSIWKIRELAISKIATLTQSDSRNEVLQQLTYLAKNDSTSSVREDALAAIDENYKSEKNDSLFVTAVNDSSYSVVRTALEIILRRDEDLGLEMSKQLEKDFSAPMMNIVSGIYSKYGDEKQAAYMAKVAKSANGNYNQILQYGKFLMRIENRSLIEDGLKILMDSGKNAQPWYNRMSAGQILSELSAKFSKKEKEAEEKNDVTSQNKYMSLHILTEKYLTELKDTEKDPQLKKIYGKE